MQRRRYAIYDVFTDRPLAGNPLAVVFDCEGLDTGDMQKIAREFNLSESTFILPPQDARHAARVRIFTPDYEMPFAGHPTVGSAIAIAQRRDMPLPAILVLEEQIGPVRCAVSKVDGLAFAEFDLARLPERLPLDVSGEAVASALGLGVEDIGFDSHEIALWSAGVPYVTIPVKDLAAVGKVAFDNQKWMALAPKKQADQLASAYVYSRETVVDGSAFHARMFVPGATSYEDPATGSATAAFAGAVVVSDRPADGALTLQIEQGVEMGRPSRIRLGIDIAGGEITGARIGGSAVKVAEGMLSL